MSAGSHFFALEPEEEVLELIDDHEDDHIDYGNSLNMETMFAAVIGVDRLFDRTFNQGALAAGQPIFSMGGFNILAGGENPNYVETELTIIAPNIHENAGTHTHVDDTPVVRSTELGTYVTNLIVEGDGALGGDALNAGWRPGLNWNNGICRGDTDLLQNARLRFTPYEELSGSGIYQPVPHTMYRFGRAEDDLDPTGVGDGIWMQRNDGAYDQEVLIQCHSSLPNIRIHAKKESDVPFLECLDSIHGNVVCAISNKGEFLDHWHEFELGELRDQVAHSVLTGNDSLYVGNLRFSWDETAGRERIKKLAGVPTRLLTAPYSVVPADYDDVSPTLVTAQHWLKIARQKAGDTTIAARDIFPVANEGDWASCGLDHCATLSSDCQTQLSGIDTRLSTAESDITAVESSAQSNSSSLTAQAVDISSLQGTAAGNSALIASNNTTLSSDIASLESDKQDLIEQAHTVYCDSKRVDAYTEDGSLARPYKTLASAVTAKLGDSATDTIRFVLASGTYSGAIDRQKPVANQSFVIEGAGIRNTKITSGALATNAIYLRRFENVQLKDLTIRDSKYGFYPRDCQEVTLSNVRFFQCGSIGTTNRHDLSGTQAEQAAYWASADTSDGGACRIRSVVQVRIQQCEAVYCARGLRIQDCGATNYPSVIQGCRIYRTLEAGIYLASGSYDGAGGCRHFKISGNHVRETSNNGILVIGGAHNSVKGNTVTDCANAGIMVWHPLDCTVQGNTLMNCCRLEHNGVGNLADSWASIHVEGATSIGAGHHIVAIHDNTILECNAGRAASIRGISLMHGAYVAHPTASNKAFVGHNRSDAVDHLFNPNSVVIRAPDVTLPKVTPLTALSWDSHLQVIDVTADDALTGAIPIIPHYSMSGQNRLYIKFMSNKVQPTSIVVASLFNEDGFTLSGFLATTKVLYEAGRNYIRFVVGASLGSNTHDHSANATVGLTLNFAIM
jgi:parallel beta-helix repeat protein